MVYTLGEYLNAMTVLERASQHLAAQFNVRMPPNEMQSHLNARELLLRHRIRTHNEAMKHYNIDSPPITQADIDDAVNLGKGQ